jgi:hypothetical protein
VETARAWSVPRSIFLGRVVGAGEPLWLPEDRWWALALAEVEAGTCRDCGHALAETTSAGSEDAYDAEVTKCHGCVGAAKRVAAFMADGGKSEGLQVRVTRRRP